MVTQAGNVRPVKIEEEMRSSYLDYAMSVIVARALPDVRDGLKPVHRRILFAMHELGLRPTSSYKKSARIVGEVLGKYHPHGDAPVYEAMVRMAQDFSLRYPLVDGQGNFGSVDDDPPAAMRYTEARLAHVAEEVLMDIERDTVDFTRNFDESLEEPKVMPARLPNLLVNGASGIAVGMATNIPPHNLGEVCDAIGYLIDNPEASVEELLRFIQGPDFPTGAEMKVKQGDSTSPDLLQAYSTGVGRVIVRAKAEIQETSRTGRRQIFVTELPYQVNKATLVGKIAELVRDKRIEGITDIRDESDRRGMRVVLELRRDAQPEVILNNLYKLTSMQMAFNINMLALVDGQPRVLNIKQVLRYYVEFRQVVVERRSRFELKKAQERAHILEGLRIAIGALDLIIRLIRQSPDVDTARQQLMEQFKLTEIQAQAILDMQLRRLTALDRQKLEEEYQGLVKRIADLEALLADPAKILAVVREETIALKEEFGDARRTTVGEVVSEFRREEMEPHESIVVTLSQRGYIKRIPLSTYSIHHRGGKGVRGMTTREDDAMQHLLVADTHDLLLFFTHKGRVYACKGYDVPRDSSRATRGIYLPNLVNLAEQGRVCAVVAVPSLQSQEHLVLATKKGIIKLMPVQAFANIRSSGLAAMNLKENDELVSARLSSLDKRAIMVTELGRALVFPLGEVPLRSRQAGGVKGIRLGPGDKVVSMDTVNGERMLLSLSSEGFGKLTPLRNFPVHHRGGGGVMAFRVSDLTGPLAAAQVIAEAQEVIVVSAKAQVFRTNLSEIPVQGRSSRGALVMRQDAEDRIASVACLPGAFKPQPSKDGLRPGRPG
ncbi:MAG: DNA gyrase subunit A [Chloroflexi bacterium]|nr:DNA gyrase subunit A [Chloroflexota bacterium]